MKKNLKNVVGFPFRLPDRIFGVVEFVVSSEKPWKRQSGSHENGDNPSGMAVPLNGVGFQSLDEEIHWEKLV